MKDIEKACSKKLNSSVHCTTSITFVPGSVDSIAYNTYRFDTLQIESPFCKELVNAKELYECLKEHYENN